MTQRWALALLLPLGCGGPATPTAAPSTAPTSTMPALASDAPEPITTAPAPKSGAIAVTVEPIATSLDGPEGQAPCDFRRLYRGKLGERGLSVVLRKLKQDLGGSLHYDSDRPALAIDRGRADADGGFEFSLKGGASFRGACDAKTGVLRGSAISGKKSESFELFPRPESWPALYALRRMTRVEANHPACRVKAKPNEATEVSIGDDQSTICLPTNRKKRAELVADGVGVCSAEDFGVRVWDLDAKLEKAANAALASAFYDHDAHAIKTCHGIGSISSNSQILFAAEGVVTANEFHSEYFGGAHPMNSISGGRTIDLRTGAILTLDDIVTRPDALKGLVANCIAPFERVRDLEKSTAIARAETEAEEPVASCNEGSGPYYLWGCDGDARSAPKWALVEGGIAIFANGNAHAVAVYDGMGPIVSWEALLREKLLRADSPVARLWRDKKAALPRDPVCSSGFASSKLVRWRLE